MRLRRDGARPLDDGDLKTIINLLQLIDEALENVMEKLPPPQPYSQE